MISCNRQGQESKQVEEEQESDAVMPGFRFHPTEEELVEFYLRRKVEGKRFNVDLITFLDLYRYDPWELPGLAAIGEKEWYFYVPRDRKYRNGDRPNRVTKSGYWKATGADRMIRSDNSLRSIGLKKTLVFYTGKAPKGIRTGWIMHEYRLPQHETQRLQKGEISLCRVYKRAGVEYYPSLHRSHPTKSRLPQFPQKQTADQPIIKAFQGSSYNTYGGSPHHSNAKLSESSPSSSTDIGTNLAGSCQNAYTTVNPLLPMASSSSKVSASDERMILHEHKQICYASLSPNSCPIMFFSTPFSHAVDDLHKLANAYNDPGNSIASLEPHFSALQPEPPRPLQSSGLAINVAPGPLQPALVERLWDWNAVLEAGKDYTDLFK